MKQTKTTHDRDNTRKGLYIIFYTEMQELFGRFAIISLLVLYLTKTLHATDSQAFTVLCAFIALNFITPLLGGYLSDRHLGFKHSVILGGFIMVFGNLMLVIPNINSIYLGLTIVAIGSGFYAPTLAAMVGRLYENKEHLRDRGFTIYYIGKNVGVLLAPILCGIIGQRYGYNYAFILSSISMLSGVMTFIIGNKHLKNNEENISHARRSVFSNVLIYIFIASMIPLVFLIIYYSIAGYILFIAGTFALLAIAKMVVNRGPKIGKQIAYIFIMTLFVIIFFAFLNQGGTTLNLFIDRLIDRKVMGFTVPTSVFYSLDPVFMIIIGGIFAIVAGRIRKSNRTFSAPTKFAGGMFLFSLGFLVFYSASQYAATHGQASMLFVVGGYFLFPMAELLIMPIGYSIVSKYTPPDLMARMMAIFLLAQAVASYMTGMISQYGKVTFKLNTPLHIHQAAAIYSHLFLVTAVILLITCVIILISKPFIQRLGALPQS